MPQALYLRPTFTPPAFAALLLLLLTKTPARRPDLDLLPRVPLPLPPPHQPHAPTHASISTIRSPKLPPQPATQLPFSLFVNLDLKTKDPHQPPDPSGRGAVEERLAGGDAEGQVERRGGGYGAEGAGDGLEGGEGEVGEEGGEPLEEYDQGSRTKLTSSSLSNNAQITRRNTIDPLDLVRALQHLALHIFLEMYTTYSKNPLSAMRRTVPDSTPSNNALI